MDLTRPSIIQILRVVLLAVGALLLGAGASAAFPNPVLRDREVADPGVLFHEGTYYVASTDPLSARGTRPRLPIRRSSNLVSWRDNGFVFRHLPDWVDGNEPFWAPQIYYFKKIDRFVAYYSAVHKRGRGKRCIGRAISKKVGGGRVAKRLDNFTDRGFQIRGRRQPLCNPSFEYSLIDPSFFVDPGGGGFLLYKRDRDDRPKEIAISTADADDGGSPLGDPRVILTPDPPPSWESDHRASVEAPTMVFREGWYYLFYSGSAFETDNYGVGVARSRDPRGQFDKNPSPPDGTGNPILSAEVDDDFCGAGHQDIVKETSLMFYHAWPNNICQPEPGRRLMVDALRWDGPDGWPTVGDNGTPSSDGRPAAIDLLPSQLVPPVLTPGTTP